MQAYNPYLPSNEYVPDAEPYLFGERVYIYGSHDRFDAPIFCMNDYVCWSAPASDLADWRYEGIIYRKKQDPMNRFGIRLLFAPDVTQGPDGRYYLYYAFDFLGVMGVAVCDTPAGEYQFYGHVRFPDRHRWSSKSGEEMPFDPGVLMDDDGRIFLYSGFATKVPSLFSRMHNLMNGGCSVLELEPDMLTIKIGPNLILPRKGNGAPPDFTNHEFFEASSIRKIRGKYYLVYSSVHNHELCYAVSNRPDGPYSFGGTLISIGDLFLNGNSDESKAVNYLGNTHGGLLNVGDRWYILYHRQTNRHSYSRQACAEQITLTPDGHFLQAEMTSCGLNNGPLHGEGEYNASIACNLWSKEGTGRYDEFMPFLRFWHHPYFTQNAKDGNKDAIQYIKNMRDGAVAGFKYFSFKGLRSIRLVIGGRCNGLVQISDKTDFSNIVSSIQVKTKKNIASFENAANISDGIKALYFKFVGKGHMDFYSFDLSKETMDA
jgi:arabinoxylan arabinofuranohydrolase